MYEHVNDLIQKSFYLFIYLFETGPHFAALAVLELAV